jgi:hypothetical protein
MWHAPVYTKVPCCGTSIQEVKHGCSKLVRRCIAATLIFIKARFCEPGGWLCLRFRLFASLTLSSKCGRFFVVRAVISWPGADSTRMRKLGRPELGTPNLASHVRL